MNRNTVGRQSIDDVDVYRSQLLDVYRSQLLDVYRSQLLDVYRSQLVHTTQEFCELSMSRKNCQY